MTIRNSLLSATLIGFAVITIPHQAKAALAGQPCAKIGTTNESDDRGSTLACLYDQSNSMVWTDLTAHAKLVTPVNTADALPASSANWQGPYAGASVGAGMTNGSISAVDDYGIDNFSSGFAQGGSHAGYNFQMKNAVLGIEAEANLGSQDHRGTMAASLSGVTTKSQINWSTALLGRAGIALGNTLFFVDAGPAFAHLSGAGQFVYSGGRYAFNEWQPGIKGGGGLEFMVTQNISIRAQYSVLDIA